MEKSLTEAIITTIKRQQGLEINSNLVSNSRIVNEDEDSMVFVFEFRGKFALYAEYHKGINRIGNITLHNLA